jgi:haloalkane dehalogenase
MEPDWLNRDDYPFKSNFFQTDIGKIHYVDEGEGDPIVFFHGNPAWSYQFRNLIKVLSKDHRCIAHDMIGFLLSNKPVDFSYLPKDQFKLIDEFLESLDLQKMTIVVGDWGGPVGLSYALAHPERISNIVINNTWLWSVKNDWYYQMFSKFTGGPIGKFLIYNRNFFARDIVKAAYGDKKKLTEEVHSHYMKPIEKKEHRKGSWVFPREIIGSTDWLSSQWEKIHLLKDKKVLLAWGMKDIAFREKELKRWMDTFPDAKVVRYKDAGHFVTDEKPYEIVEEMRKTFGI